MIPRLSLITAALVALVQSATAAPTCFASFRKEDFSDCVVMGKVALHWSANTTVIRFGVDAAVSSNSGNWVGVGLSDQGGMRGSDLWILIKNSDGTYKLQDSYSKDFELPAADSSQDVQLLTAPAPSDTNTVYTFQRAIATCDTDDYPVVKGREHSLVWAVGSSQTLAQHSPTNRGDAKAILWKDDAVSTPSSNSTDERLFEIMMKNITVPSNVTSYMCMHFSMPADQKYHAIRYGGVAKTKYVHHMIVYSCTAPPKAPAADVDFYQCARMDAACNELTYTWTPGAALFSYPPEAGVPFGQNSQRYFSLQVHYNNPDGDTGAVDTSGFQIYYTNKMRQYDVGTIGTGTVEISIPGNNPSPYVLTPNVCPGTCTSKFPWNLTIISVTAHMHTLGLNMSIQRLRGGKELAPLHVRRYYDFNYQGASTVDDPELKRLVPGDALITTCGYRPTEGVRPNVTTFGEASQQEMCVAFIQYYPKTPIESCMTISQIQRTICTTQSKLEGTGLNGEVAQLDPTLAMAAIQNLTASGDLLPVERLTFDKYSPQCAPSARVAAVSGGMPAPSATVAVTSTAGAKSAAGRSRVAGGWVEAVAALVVAMAFF
ncbi:hypothetical protein HDU96_008963 [Phlyctochytrium bullatum]|nr:hypothetical protein HDU96_008963 [Phlyctochytrium bullatum]